MILSSSLYKRWKVGKSKSITAAPLESSTKTCLLIMIRLFLNQNNPVYHYQEYPNITLHIHSM